MANERMEQSRKRWEDHGEGGASSQSARNMGDKARETASQWGSQAHQGMESTRAGMASGYEHAEGLVSRHPAPAVAFGFGMGFGLGLFLALALRPRQEHAWSEWSDWTMPDSVRQLPQHLRRLSDSISSYVEEKYR